MTTPDTKESETIMKVKIFKNKEEASVFALSCFAKALEKNRNAVFGLATGSTPITLYEKICESNLDFTDATSINLDEYYGLSNDNKQSYHYFMNKNLFSKKPFKESFLPNGENKNVENEIASYNKIIEEHPIDLQILGIGHNGHIGFNEPGSSFTDKTRLVDLTASTIEANKRFFKSIDEVPKQAYSMGIGSILGAKGILLLAFGKGKAEIIKKTIQGPYTTNVPATALQKHKNVILLLDEDAASLL